MKKQKEDLVKIVRTDIELKNTLENGLDVWPVITKDNHWLISYDDDDGYGTHEFKSNTTLRIAKPVHLGEIYLENFLPVKEF